MSDIRIVTGLPFVTVTLRANGQTLVLDHVLLDTGSAASVFKTDDLRSIGVTIEPPDRIRFMIGIGGEEAVVEKKIDGIEVGILSAQPFTIQLGALDYGVKMDGILGLDFLLNTQAILDFKTRKITPAS